MSEETSHFEIAQTLADEKERLGNLNVIEIKADNMTRAHELLGKEVSVKAKQSLLRKLNDYSDYDEFDKDMDVMARVYTQITKKITSPEVLPEIREGLAEYLVCLDARSRGIGTETIKHPLLEIYLREHVGQEDFIYHTLLPLNSQNDNVGCQSGMTKNGEAVLLWHTEEDYEEEKGERIDKARLIKFMIHGEVTYSFVYPDLMPGPAFGFGDNFFYSVDFNYIKANEKPSILANTGVWVAWRLADRMMPEEIIKGLGPYLDGYTLNYVWRGKHEENYQAGKIEFAHGLIASYRLNNKPLVSVNEFEGNSPLKKLEIMDVSEIELFNERKRRAIRALALMDKIVEGKTGSLENLRRMTGFTSKKHGGEAGMAVDFTKAHVVAKATSEGLIVWVSSGPTIKNEAVSVFDFRKSS